MKHHNQSRAFTRSTSPGYKSVTLNREPTPNIYSLIFKEGVNNNTLFEAEVIAQTIFEIKMKEYYYAIENVWCSFQVGIMFPPIKNTVIVNFEA